jgi:hypothetical protein
MSVAPKTSSLTAAFGIQIQGREGQGSMNQVMEIIDYFHARDSSLSLSSA